MKSYVSIMAAVLINFSYGWAFADHQNSDTKSSYTYQCLARYKPIGGVKPHKPYWGTEQTDIDEETTLELAKDSAISVCSFYHHINYCKIDHCWQTN